MSSVTRFLRQIPVATTYYSLPDNFASLFTFSPDASNYVGNYPPGTVTAASLSNAAGQWLVDTGVYTSAAAPQRDDFVLRDMGKTIKSDAGQYYRAVQVLSNDNLVAVSGITGGPVTPSAAAKFGTLYIPVKIAGNGVSAAGAYAIAGGQM
jgi:hypothetical protein